MPTCTHCGGWENALVSICSTCGATMPPPDPARLREQDRVQPLTPEALAARDARRKRRREAREEERRFWESPEGQAAIRRRDVRNLVGCLMPPPAVAGVAAGALVVLANEAIPVAILATLVGSLAGWLGVFLVYVMWQSLFYAPPSHWLQIYMMVVHWIPSALAIGATVLVGRII